MRHHPRRHAAPALRKHGQCAVHGARRSPRHPDAKRCFSLGRRQRRARPAQRGRTAPAQRAQHGAAAPGMAGAGRCNRRWIQTGFRAVGGHGCIGTWQNQSGSARFAARRFRMLHSFRPGSAQSSRGRQEGDTPLRNTTRPQRLSSTTGTSCREPRIRSAALRASSRLAYGPACRRNSGASLNTARRSSGQSSSAATRR